MSTILENIVSFFSNFTTLVGMDIVFFIALAVEVAIVLFFLFKSIFSYEAKLNRALEKLNYWLFEKKVVTEDNIREFNMLFKTKAPKRLCYYWQQYILFREGTPSTYLSTDNLIEKPLKTSAYASNIKNLSLFTGLWAFVVSMFVLIATGTDVLYGSSVIYALLCPIFVLLIGIIFVVYLRFRKNSTLNSLYQNVSLFDRFMDNACIDLPSYIDYQILFTPQEIENGQPVLREFLDYKARKEKEEFNRAKQEDNNHEEFDFSATGVDGSIVLDRAMKESELFLKKKEKILLKISQLESGLDSRRKNFDNVQKDYQTKIQASKENVDRLRVMQEETTNRIESNYYRKQQTQEIAKQEQLEQEFEQQRAKYLLEKSEGEEEISKLNAQLQEAKGVVEEAMINEYQTFFNKFCKSAQKVVAKAFAEKINSLKEENETANQKINELQIKLKDIPQGVYDGSLNDATDESQKVEPEGQYDENGNYVYANGTYYDKNGNFHDENGDVYSQEGKLIIKAPEVKKEKQTIDFDSFDVFDFMTDSTQKGDIYGVAEDVVKELDSDDNFEVVNNAEKNDPIQNRAQKVEVQEEETEELKSTVNQEELPTVSLEDLNSSDFVPPVEEEETEPEVEEDEPSEIEEVEEPKFEDLKIEKPAEEKPRKKAGRPRKIVTREPSNKKRGRPRKETPVDNTPKRKVGRPRKIVNTPPTTIKRGRGRPKKKNTIDDINKQLMEEQARINQLSQELNKDVQEAVTGINANNVDSKMARREQLIKEIENLQREAQQAMTKNQPESKLEEINNRLEGLLEEIKKLNS